MRIALSVIVGVGAVAVAGAVAFQQPPPPRPLPNVWLEPVRKQRYQCLLSHRLLWPVRTHTMEPLFMNRALPAVEFPPGQPGRPSTQPGQGDRRQMPPFMQLDRQRGEPSNLEPGQLAYDGRFTFARLRYT